MTDFIVVGAGTAGSVVAGELAARGFTVVLTEAGAAIHQQPMVIRRPAAYLRSFGSQRDWNFATVPQSKLAGRRIRWPRGRGEGGSGLINAMIYLPAPDKDFDCWERLAGTHWSASAMNAREVAMRQRLGDAIETIRFLSPTTRAALDAATELWGNHSLRPHQVFCRRGQRVTTADLFLSPTNRNNRLTRLTNCVVSRVILKQQRAIGIETSKGQEVFASRGIVLCGGTIGSPQLLFASGIASPEVGKNLQDHLVMPFIFSVDSHFRFPIQWSSSNRLAQRLMGRGPVVSNLAEASGLFDLPQSEKNQTDVRQAIQLLVTPTHYLKYPAAEAPPAITLAVVGASPYSRGELRFSVAENIVATDIDPGYLNDVRDLEALIEAAPLVRELSRHPRITSLGACELLPGAERSDKNSLERTIRRFAQTLYHPVGTCRMGLDSASVVDPQLAVRGVERLWVVDASVFPTLTTTNPQATLLAIALAAVDWIR